MKKIRQILKEETSDPFAGVPNDLLFDFLQEFEGEYNESKAKQFCKYFNDLKCANWAKSKTVCSSIACLVTVFKCKISCHFHLF